jgi:hypothetical protein
MSEETMGDVRLLNIPLRNIIVARRPPAATATGE